MPLALYQQIYQVAPIILTGGSASQIPGMMMPMMALTDPLVWEAALGLGDGLQTLDEAFGAFSVLPGGSLVQQAIAKYPLANQAVAGNAVIREPLTISLIWDTPMRGAGAWALKQAIMTALKASLDLHNNAGGTYTVVTPAMIFADLVMTGLTDSSRGSSPLPQNAWRFDFEKPLITLADAQGAQNNLTSKLSAGLPSDGKNTGVASAIGGPGGATPSNAPDTVGPTLAGTPAYEPGGSTVVPLPPADPRSGSIISSPPAVSYEPGGSNGMS